MTLTFQSECLYTVSILLCLLFHVSICLSVCVSVSLSYISKFKFFLSLLFCLSSLSASLSICLCVPLVALSQSYCLSLHNNTQEPLQMIQNAAARLVFNQPKRAHVTPLLIELHWLPVAARIKFKSLMLDYSDCWFCSHLPKCSCKGKCYTQDAALVYGASFGTTVRASTAIQTIFICSSTLVERTAYYYQSRGVPLYLQEAFEDPTLQRAPPLLTGTLTSS